MSTPPAVRSRRVLAAVLAAWAVVLGAGFATLASYETTPGEAGATPETWPAASALPRPASRPALVVLAHPRCPCTRATVAELERLMRRVHGRADAYVLFVQPESLEDRWAESDLWDRAAAIPGVRVVRDPDGAEARRFGAETSGHAVLYGADAALLFSGGLTASRGHEGANAGRSAVQDLVLQAPTRTHTTSVYGCPLRHPEA